MTEPERCFVCDLATQVLGCKPGACCAPVVPINMGDLIEAITKEASAVSDYILANISLPVAGAIAATALIRAKIKTDGDDPEMWFDLIRDKPISEAGILAMERVLGLVRKGTE